MVNVRQQTREILIEMFGAEASELIDYAFDCNLLDQNKCRIALIKKTYKDFTKEMTCTEAKFQTAEMFCISEKTVENIIYNDFYKPIKFLKKQAVVA